MTRRIAAISSGPALALAISGCGSVPTLTFAEAGTADDASDATADAPQDAFCPALEGGTVLCRGSCAGACDLCAAQCTSAMLCCATKNGITCKNAGAACQP